MTVMIYSALVWLGWVCPPSPPARPASPRAVIQPVGRPTNVRPWVPPDRR